MAAEVSVAHWSDEHMRVTTTRWNQNLVIETLLAIMVGIFHWVEAIQQRRFLVGRTRAERTGGVVSVGSSAVICNFPKFVSSTSIERLSI